MRILFLCSSLEHAGLTGEVEATARLALAAGHQARVFTPYKARDDSTIRRHLPRTIPLDSGQEQFVPCAAELDFWDAQARGSLQGCDLLHLFGKPNPFLARAARQAQSIGLKTIDEDASQVTPEYAMCPDHQQFAALSAVCDVIVARCHRHVERLREHNRYRGATRIIEQWAYGIETELLAIDRTVRDVTSQGCVFGTIGRLDDRTGVEVLLRAFARVRQDVADVRFRIAGQGKAERDLRRLADELNLNHQVEFVGELDGHEKIGFYASIDAFVIASQSDGGSITSVEAMAAALPIMSTPAGAMPERLNDGTEALFFDIESVDGLAAGMRKLLQNRSLRRALGGAARYRYHLRNHSRVCAAQKSTLWEELGGRAPAERSPSTT